MTLAAEDANFDIENGIIDSETPPHTLLAAEYKQSFAYYTFRVRLPSTLQTIADSLAKDKDELLIKYGADADIEQTAAAVLELRSNIRKNGPLLPFNDKEFDAGEWNAFLDKLPKEKRTYFSACWLYAECYMYRKIWSIFEGSRLAGYDYFCKQKQTAAQLSLDAMLAVAKGTRQNDRNSSTFQQLMKFNLWGNRCDLSITSGKQIKPTGDAFDQQVAELDDNLLVDATSSIWDALDKSDGNGIVEFIFDNSGYELYTDLILAEYIIDKGLAKKVRFNAKAIPWFISDVMAEDYHWTLQFLIDQTDSVLSDLGKKLKRFTDEGTFELAPLEHFWTSPYEFYRMAEVRPELYKRLSLAQLVIFKGDLNYRKLLGDYSWHSTEPFETCLRGFRPTNVCTLRTIKADLVCGLPDGKSKELYAKNKEWMLTGEYGTIQFASK